MKSHHNVRRLSHFSRLVTCILGAASLCGFASLSSAQSLKAPKTQATNNLYAGLELGAATITDRATETANEYALSATGSASVEQDRSKSAFRLFGGIKYNEQLALELGYLQSSTFKSTVSGTNSSGTTYSGTEDFKFSGLDYALVLRPKIATGYNNLYFKLGGHTLTRKLDSAVPGVLTNSDSVSGTGLLYGVGYDLPTSWRGVDVRLAYTHYDKVGGESGSKASLYSLGVSKRY